MDGFELEPAGGMAQGGNVKLIISLIGTILALALSGCISTAPEIAPTEPSEPAEEPKPETPAAKPLTAAEISEVDASQLLALRSEGRALIYDVRLPIYHKLGHIDGATLFYPKPFDDAFEKEEPQMKKALSDGKTIILYCGSEYCNDSKVVAEMIAKRGIPVSVYPGGWDEWKTIGIE